MEKINILVDDFFNEDSFSNVTNVAIYKNGKLEFKTSYDDSTNQYRKPEAFSYEVIIRKTNKDIFEIIEEQVNEDYNYREYAIVIVTKEDVVIESNKKIKITKI